MKMRIAAYATAAILIGITVMALPLTLQQSSLLPPRSQTPADTTSSPKSSGFNGATSSISGLVKQPVNLVPIGGILLSGLIVAISVYLILRRQMP